MGRKRTLLRLPVTAPAGGMANDMRRALAGVMVDDVRVFYDVSGSTVQILAIVNKSEAESWLTQFGSLE